MISFKTEQTKYRSKYRSKYLPKKNKYSIQKRSWFFWRQIWIVQTEEQADITVWNLELIASRQKN